MICIKGLSKVDRSTTILSNVPPNNSNLKNSASFGSGVCQTIGAGVMKRICRVWGQGVVGLPGFSKALLII